MKHKLIKKSIAIYDCSLKNKIPENLFKQIKKSEKVLDIGCGKNKMKGAIGIDIANVEGVDYVINIDKEKLPFADNYFSKVYCIHVLEHCENIIEVMNEIYRVCKSNALIMMIVPYGNSMRYLQDPTHKTPITEDVVKKYLCTSEYVQQYSDMGFKGNFELLDLYIYGDAYNKLDLHFMLKAKKYKSKNNDNKTN